MTHDEMNQTNEMQSRLRFEAFISDLSARFVKLSPGEVDQEIERALQKVMNFFQGDRCGLIEVHAERKFTRVTHASYVEGIPRVPRDINLADFFPWHMEQLTYRGEPVRVERLADFPPEAEKDRESAMAMGIKSLLTVPVFIGERVAYHMTVQTVRRERSWPEEYIPRLRLLAEIFVNALSRKAADEVLKSQLSFETLLSDLSARFIALPANKVDDAIEDAQRFIVETLGLDRSVAYQFSPQTNAFLITHLWSRPGSPPLPDISAMEKYPWAHKKLAGGESFWFSRVDELPTEAARDVESHLAYHAKSSSGFPLFAGDKIFGAVTFTALKHECEWTDVLLGRLRLVAEIFSNALARKLAEESLQDYLKEIEQLKEQLEKDNVYLREEVKLLHEHGEIVGESETIRRVLVKVEQVAPTESTVLILGETGTGKELLARAIHAMSKRGDRPLVTVNCASLPPALIESELFGREKGAYTGALTRMTGRFETAEGSTLFLDEIGELPYEVQSKLLRVLETGTFERLGSTKTIHLNVRIIAATNRDLTRDVNDGRFRKDLFYRLNVFPMTIPPLRERTEDIPALVWAFVQQFEKKMGKRIESIPQKSMDALSHYPWPGNIRELKNVIEHAMIISQKTLEILQPALDVRDEVEMDALEDVERRHILRVLERTGWRIAGKNGAAEILGIKRTTLYAMMKTLGINRPHS
jgi:formate hydrogenlyase transcriptional activator